MDDTPPPFSFFLSGLTVDPLLVRPTNIFHNEPPHTDSASYPSSSSSLLYAPLIHAGTRPLYFATPTHAGEGVQVPGWPCYMGTRPTLLDDEMSAGLGMGSDDGGGLTPEDLQAFLPSPVIHYAPPVPSHTLTAPSYMNTATTPTDISFPSHSATSNSSLAVAHPDIGGRAPFHASSATSTSTSPPSHADAFLAPPQPTILSASSAPSALVPAASSVHGAEAGVVSPPLPQPPVGFRMLNTPVAGYSHPAMAGLEAGAGKHAWSTAPVSTPSTATFTSSIHCYFPGGLPTTPVSARADLPHPSPSSSEYDSDDSTGSFIIVNSSAAHAFAKRSRGYSVSSAETPDEDDEDEVDGATGVKALGSSPVDVSTPSRTTIVSNSTPPPITSPTSPYSPAYTTSSVSSSPAPSSPAPSDGSDYTPFPVGKKRSAGGVMGGAGATKRAKGKRSSGDSSSASSGAGSMAVVAGGMGGRGKGMEGGDSRPKWLIASEAAARARDKATADGGKLGTRGRVVTGDFLWKVFIMLTHPKYRKWVKWDPTIRKARVDDTRAFAENVYRRHCSSGKWESFQRNLTNYNGWGFRREVVPGTGKKSQTIFLPTWQRVKSRWETVGGSMETLTRAELELPMEEIEGTYGSSAPPSGGLLVSVSESDDEDDLGLESEEETLADQRARKRRELDEAQLSVGLHGKLLSPIKLVPRKMRVAGGSGGDCLSPRSSGSSVSPMNPFAGRSSSPNLGTTYPITPVSASPRISRFAKRPPSPVGSAKSQTGWYMV
ncbi:hypothetical protein IAT38_008169 [Cryptococcus sp. DSM 104549]